MKSECISVLATIQPPTECVRRLCANSPRHRQLPAGAGPDQGGSGDGDE